MSQRPRVPLPAQVELAGVNLNVQVNHCKTPGCANFGVPARTEPGKTGPSKDRDMNYKVHSTAKGQIPSIKCKSCGLNPPMKSNAGVADEVARLLDVDPIATSEGKPSANLPIRPVPHPTRSTRFYAAGCIRVPLGYHRRFRPKGETPMSKFSAMIMLIAALAPYAHTVDFDIEELCAELKVSTFRLYAAAQEQLVLVEAIESGDESCPTGGDLIEAYAQHMNVMEAVRQFSALLETMDTESADKMDTCSYVSVADEAALHRSYIERFQAACPLPFKPPASTGP